MLENVLINRKVFYFCSIFSIGMFLYGFILIGVDGTRMDDDGLSLFEANILEASLLIIGGVSIFLVLVSAIFHAFKHDRNKWVLMIIFIWPLSFVYGALINTKYVE
jgi:hypothetical protein